MQVIIDIPDRYFELLKEGKVEHGSIIEKRTIKAVKNGIPLPKNHGRILDENEILDFDNMYAKNGKWFDLEDMPQYIKNLKAIVENDSKKEDK